MVWLQCLLLVFIANPVHCYAVHAVLRRLSPYLDDDQAELTLQQKQEALADAIGRVSSLQLRKDRFSLEFGTISSMTRVCVCVSPTCSISLTMLTLSPWWKVTAQPRLLSCPESLRGERPSVSPLMPPPVA